MTREIAGDGSGAGARAMRNSRSFVALLLRMTGEICGGGRGCGGWARRGNLHPTLCVEWGTQAGRIDYGVEAWRVERHLLLGSGHEALHEFGVEVAGLEVGVGHDFLVER